MVDDAVNSSSPQSTSPVKLSSSSQSQYAANYISSSTRSFSSSDLREVFVAIRFEGKRASSSKHKFSAAASGSKPSAVEIAFDETLSLLGEIKETSEVTAEIHLKESGSGDHYLLVATAQIPLSSLGAKAKKPASSQIIVDFLVQREDASYLSSAQGVIAVSGSEVPSDRLPKELTQPVVLPAVPSIDAKVDTLPLTYGQNIINVCYLGIRRNGRCRVIAV